MKKFKSILMCALIFGAVSCSLEQNELASEALPIPEIPEDPYHISMDAAQKDVEGLLKSFTIDQTKGLSRIANRRIVSKWSTSPSVKSYAGSDKEIYIFNFSDSMGFALYSSSPKEGLLGFALSGSLDPDTEVDNPGFILTLGALESQLDTEHIVPGPGEEWEGEVYGEWENTFYEPTFGYCKTKWGERVPFNNFRSDSAPVGSVSVAVAQLMSIYKYPSSYNSFSFDWNAMIAYPYSVNSQNQLYVSKLMEDLGLSTNLNENYSDTLKIAYAENAPRTFTHFGYTYGGTYGNYSSSTVMHELELGYPVLVGGHAIKKTTIKKVLGVVVETTVKYDYGRFWLAHGLLTRRRMVYVYSQGAIVNTYQQVENYLLCNFGWNGNADGFYPVNVFDTTDGPSMGESILTRGTTTTTEGTHCNYQFDFKAVTGIRK